MLLVRLPISLTVASGNISAVRLVAGALLPVLIVAVVSVITAAPGPRPEQAAALVIIGCGIDHERLSEKSGALTASEAKELRRLGLAGRLGVVAIITPWRSDPGAVGAVQPLPIGEPPNGRPREGPRTVIVVPQFPDAPLELAVAFTTAGLYVRRDKGWTMAPNTPGSSTKRVRIEPILAAPGNVTVRLEGVSIGSSFRYCQ